jgi:hypothetical protein
LPGKEHFHIKVRVLCLWEVPAFLNPRESSALEMVLIDEKVSFYMFVSYFCFYGIVGYNFVCTFTFHVLICWLYLRGKNHATIRKQLIYMFESKLEEGQVYEMSSFSIFSPKRFLSTLHPYKFVFQIKTKLKLSESSDISQLGLTFTNLAEITAHTRD